MKTTNKKTLEEIIRVDHAGERGAIKIYEGQLLALNTFKKNEKLKKLIEEMKEHEKEHFEYFDKAIKDRNIKLHTLIYRNFLNQYDELKTSIIKERRELLLQYEKLDVELADIVREDSSFITYHGSFIDRLLRNVDGQMARGLQLYEGALERYLKHDICSSSLISPIKISES